MKRNASIELYRILLMYGIVALHVAYVLGPASGVNHSAVCFGLGLVVFVATLLFDFPRRMLVALVRRFWYTS